MDNSIISLLELTDKNLSLDPKYVKQTPEGQNPAVTEEHDITTVYLLLTYKQECPVW